MNRLIKFELQLEYNARAVLFKLGIPALFFALQYGYAHIFRISSQTLTIENFERETSAFFFHMYIPVLAFIFSYRFSQIFSTGFFAHIITSTRSKLSFFILKSISHTVQIIGLTSISLILTYLIYVQVPEPDPFLPDITMFSFGSFVGRAIVFAFAISVFSLVPIMWFGKNVHLLIFLYLYPQIELLLPIIERFTGTSIFIYSPINLLARLKEGGLSEIMFGLLSLYVVAFYYIGYRVFLKKKT